MVERRHCDLHAIFVERRFLTHIRLGFIDATNHLSYLFAARKA